VLVQRTDGARQRRVQAFGGQDLVQGRRTAAAGRAALAHAPHVGRDHGLSEGLTPQRVGDGRGHLRPADPGVTAAGDGGQRRRPRGDLRPLFFGAATTVTNRHPGLRKILADEHLRKNLREVDQLHPMVNKDLWLFGEDWHMTRSELGRTNVLHPPGRPPR
jgi:hypothetical protein